jgi:hypothetical protein
MPLHRQHIERRMGSMRSFPTSLRHVRPVQPLAFPASDPEWKMNESKRHALICDLVYRLFKDIVGDTCAVGCDQFVYFDGEDPKKRLAPDAFVKLGVTDSLFDSWQTWEHGSPELCVEIVSPSDTGEYLPLKMKMRRYHALGVQELIVFDMEREVGTRLRAFDRIDGDLVERVVDAETTPCVTLTNASTMRFDWFLAPADDMPLALRLRKNDVTMLTLTERLEVLRKENESLARENEKLKQKR